MAETTARRSDSGSSFLIQQWNPNCSLHSLAKREGVCAPQVARLSPLLSGTEMLDGGSQRHRPEPPPPAPQNKQGELAKPRLNLKPGAKPRHSKLITETSSPPTTLPRHPQLGPDTPTRQRQQKSRFQTIPGSKCPGLGVPSRHTGAPALSQSSQ